MSPNRDGIARKPLRRMVVMGRLELPTCGLQGGGIGGGATYLQTPENTPLQPT